MIHLDRQNPPAAAAKYLERVTKRIENAPLDEQPAVAERGWKHKSRARFTEIRETLSDMCSGIERCMYCEDSEWTAIDHFVPRAQDSTLAFTWTNYLAACSNCNSNYKRDEFPVRVDGSRLLIDPTQDEPLDHLILSPTTGRYEAVGASDMGEESIRVFGLNRGTLEAGRRDAWEVLQLTLVAYGRAADEGKLAKAGRLREVVGRQPFAGVLKAIVVAAGAHEPIGVSPECVLTIESHPEIQDWPEAIFAA